MNNKLFLSLSIISLFPSLLASILGVGLSIGLLISSIFILLLHARIMKQMRINLKKLSLFSFIIIYIVLSSAYSYYNTGSIKPFVSSAVLLLIIISIFVMYKYLVTLDHKNMVKTLFAFIVLLSIFGWVKLVYTPNILQYAQAVKPVFPFFEESHYALCIGLLSVIYITLSNYKNWFIILNLLLLALIYPSLTLLLFALITLLVKSLSLNKSRFLIIFGFGSLIVFPFLLTYVFSLEYFASRLSFQDTTNLTTLVFLQGWEMAYLNFFHTNGIGLGFQMLGLDGTQFGTFTELISQYLSSNGVLNTEDGGLLAAKIIAEFGVVGLLFCIYYIISIFWIFAYGLRKIKLLKLQNNLLSNYKQLTLVKYGVMLGLIVEFFFRGYGYFSPTLFIGAAFLLYAIYKPDLKGA